MKKLRIVLLVFIIIISCLILQTSILPMILSSDITPNLMIIVTASYGFMFGDRKGMCIGLVCGLLSDIYFGPLIGFEAGVYAIIGYFSGKFQKILYVEDLAFPLSLIAVCDFVYGFLTFVFLFAMRNRLFMRAFLMQRMLPEMVYTLLAALPLYPLLRFLYNKYMRKKHHNPLEQGSVMKET